jgi:hypothetical protein
MLTLVDRAIFIKKKIKKSDVISLFMAKIFPPLLG